MSKPTKIHLPRPHWNGLAPPACDTRYIRVQSSAVIHRDVWRWLPRAIQCETCRTLCFAGPDECAPDWLIITMECVTAELAKLGDAMRAGEHRCLSRLGDPCPCGQYSILWRRWLDVAALDVLLQHGFDTHWIAERARRKQERIEWVNELLSTGRLTVPVTMEWSE